MFPRLVQATYPSSLLLQRSTRGLTTLSAATAQSLTPRAPAYSNNINSLTKRFYTCPPRSSSPSIHPLWIQKQQRPSSSRITFSQKYTSSSSSSSTATAARLLVEESSQSSVMATAVSTASKTKTPLTFHEEMTKTRFSYNWWKEWTIIMVRSSHSSHPTQPCRDDSF